MAVRKERITWRRVNELQGKIAQRFSVSYDLKKVTGARSPNSFPDYSFHWTLTVDGSTLPEKFLSPREVFTYLSGVETGLEQTAPTVCDEVLKHMDEAEGYDFEDALLRTEKMVEYFEEHAGMLPVPIAEAALRTMEVIAKTINQDIQHRLKGPYSHNIISCALMAMAHTLVSKHQFSEKDAHQVTNLVIEAAPIITTLYGIHPEGN